MSNEKHKIAINLELDHAEMQELKETTDNIVDKGIFDRDRYLITCEAREPLIKFKNNISRQI